MKRIALLAIAATASIWLYGQALAGYPWSAHDVLTADDLNAAFGLLAAPRAFAVTLTNGPPNIPTASPSACTTTTCAWMPSNAPSGSHVSLVYADMIPMSVDYSGAFALSGANAANFSIVTTPVAYTDAFNNSKTRNVGEITTVGSLPAGDYSITVTATGANGSNSQSVTVHSATCTSTPSPGTGGLATTGTICLGAGTYNPATTGSQISNLTGILLGIGNGATIIDGNSTACGGVNQNASQVGGTIIGVQFQNYECTANAAFGYPALIFTSAVVRNTRMINSKGAGITIQGGGAFIANNYISNMGYSGMHGSIVTGATGGLTTTIIGNEITNANSTGFDTCNDAATYKDVQQDVVVTVNFSNNYLHDNSGPGPWLDFDLLTTFNISNNTYTRQSSYGPMVEQSRNGTVINHNVFAHIGDGSHFASMYCDTDAAVGVPPPYCAGGHCGFPTGDPGPSAAIYIAGGANVNVHDNNISVLDVTHPGQAFFFDHEIGNGTGFVGNNTAHDNTVNFFTTSSSAVWAWNTSGQDTSGNASNNNHFHLVGGNTSTDTHWWWMGQSNTPQTWTNYRASGQDAGSTIDTTDTRAYGCTHLACTSSGLGAGGVSTP